MKNIDIRAVVDEYLTPTGLQAPCGDNSCVFGSPGGMATNGGCRCVGKGQGNGNITVDFESRRTIQALASVIKLMAHEIASRRTP